MSSEQLTRSLQRMAMEMEEIWATIGEQPALGDDGVAEALIAVENGISLAQGKIRRRLEGCSA